ncbi:MAG: hypothetical protein AB8C13_04285 [Phycisphaerales bacterium]
MTNQFSIPESSARHLSTMTRSRGVLAGILVLVAGSVASAQEADPSADNEPKHQRIKIIDPSSQNLPTMGTNETPIEPTTTGTSSPSQTGLTEGQDWMQVVNNSISEVSKPSALAEGSFILARSGRLVPAPNDRIIFVPAPDQRLPGEGPVLLLPCATLERLENIWANQPVILSGEILTYHGRNHLLISEYALGMLTPSPSTTPPSTPHLSTPPAETAPTTGTGEDPQINTPGEQPDQAPQGLDEDPDVMDLLRELDAETVGQSTIDDRTNEQLNSGQSDSFTTPTNRSSNQLQVAPPTLAPGLREGTLLIRRPARLDRSSDGAWQAIFDNDDPNAPIGIELTILPSSLLMTMENQALQFGDSARFVVSGRVYVHNNRGYLLPTFYQRLRTTDIKPWQ